MATLFNRLLESNMAVGGAARIGCDSIIKTIQLKN